LTFFVEEPEAAETKNRAMRREDLEILLIQVDTGGAEQIRRALQGYYPNVRIQVGTTVEECLGFLGGKAYDILLLGYELLDRMDFNILDRVVGNREAPPVIVVVRPSEVWAAVSAMKAGAFDYVVQSGEYLLTLPFVIQRTLNYHRSLKEVLSMRRRLRGMSQRPIGSPLRESGAVRDLGIVDRFTQIYNQQYFEKRLAEEIDRARRYLYPLSLLAIDIDGLGLLQDSVERDQIVSGVAQMVSQVVRETDLVARRVQTDFGTLLFHSDIEGGRGVAERIRQRVEEQGVGEDHGRGSVTVSIGISGLSPGDDRPDTFISSADLALYHAKVKGGNQVVLVEKG